MVVAIDAQSHSAYLQANQEIAEASTPEQLEEAVDSYLSVSARLEAEIEMGGGDEVQLAALVAGDLRLLGYLSGLQPDDDEEAAVTLSLEMDHGSAFALDMGVASGGIVGGPPPPNLSDEFPVALSATATPTEKVNAAIDEILSDATTSIGKVIAVGFVPSGNQLIDISNQLLGPAAGDLVKHVLAGAKALWEVVKRAVAKVCGAVIARLVGLLGESNAAEVVKKAKDWIGDQIDKLGDIDILGILLDANSLRSTVAAAIAADPTKGDSVASGAAALVPGNKHALGWIGWGVAAMGGAKFFHLDKIMPWGPILMLTVGVVLVVAGAAIANDYLDARDLPPHRVDGVRSLL